MKRYFAAFAALCALICAGPALALTPPHVWSPQTGVAVIYNSDGSVCNFASGGNCASGGGGGGGAVTAVSGAYALGSIVDLGTGATPGANTTNGYLKALNTALGTPIQATGGTVGLVAGSANVGNLNPVTHGGCTVLCSNAVLKSSAGVLYSFEVQADATLAAAAWYVMIFDATSLPADGTVTPAKCFAQTPGQTQMGGTLAAGGVSFPTGIVIGVSTTGCYSKTASVHGFIAGDFQ